jgi:anti-sigma factor RsiW
MKHPKELSSHIDGTCSNSVKKRVKQHLETCPECEKFVTEYHEMRQEMISLDGYPVPAYFATKVLAKAREQARETVWNAFDILPKRVVEAMLVMSVVVIVALSLPVTSESTNGEISLDPIASNQATTTLETNDDILQFALNTIAE